MSRIYLDNNATTPLSSAIKEALPQWLEQWGNPSSVHGHGRGPKNIIRESRNAIAKMFGVDPLEIIFTAGGSEANNLALKGFYFSQKSKGSARNRILLTSTEHPSLKNTAQFLASLGVEIHWIKTNRFGEVDLHDYERALGENVLLVSAMLANNETGHLLPIREMSVLAHNVGAVFHTDAVQALGKTPIHLKRLDVDMASFAAHKFYGLKGCGILYVKKGIELESLVHGGGQERGRRGGTENSIAIASFGKMAELSATISDHCEQMRVLRDFFESEVLRRIPNCTINGVRDRQTSPRLSNTSNITIGEIDGEVLLMNLDMAGFSVSTGSACSSGSQDPSPVLLAMGLSREEAQSSLRVSLGWQTTRQEIESFCDTLEKVVFRLRALKTSKVREAYGLQ